MFSTQIIGIGSYAPEGVIKNSDLEKIVETTDQWIFERTGIRERRTVRKNLLSSSAGKPDLITETNSQLGAKAALRALEMAGKKPEEIDQIIYATTSPDILLPSASCWLQHRIGAVNASAIDMNAACSGWIYGLSYADAAIKTGQAKTILLVGAEVLTATSVDYTDRGTCILFGDGAGAVVLNACELDSKRRVYSTHLHADGNLWNLLYMPAGGLNLEVSPDQFSNKQNKIHMNGKEIFKSAVRVMADYALKALEKNNFKASDVDWFIPHQANMRIIEAVADRLGFPREKIILNIERYGNTSSASVPLAFDEAVRDGRIKKGDLVLMSVFGAGLTNGSALVRY